MASITEYLEIYTKEYLLEQALSQVNPDLDTREGAIIYDTLAIFCAKLADTFVEIKQIVEQSYIITATNDESIEYRVAERGITRDQATNAQRLGVFTYLDNTPASIPIGSLFSTINENKADVVNFQVVEEYKVDGQPILGSYILECETAGTVGNTYFGEILPLSDMDTLGSATLTTVILPARNREDNDSLKEKYFKTFNLEAFGGNLADYRRYMSSFSGVGQTQIYPRTETTDNIVLSCVDPSNQPISSEYQNVIKQTLDPENYYNTGNNTSGMGLGVVPIGHKITVMTPVEVNIDVEVTVILSQTAYFPTVQQNIENNIRTYIKQVQDLWSDGNGVYSRTVYYNKILSATINAQGVTNVTSCLVNGDIQDLILQQTKQSQTIAKLGTITVSEA